MIDSENVLLLSPARGETGFSLDRGVQVVVSIHQFREPADHEVVERLERELGRPWATLVTEESPNDFPALPVREGEHVVVRFSDREDAGADEGCGSPRRKCDPNVGEHDAVRSDRSGEPNQADPDGGKLEGIHGRDCDEPRGTERGVRGHSLE